MFQDAVQTRSSALSYDTPGFVEYTLNNLVTNEELYMQHGIGNLA